MGSKFDRNNFTVNGDVVPDLFIHQNTRIHNGIEFVTVELAAKIRDVKPETVRRWTRENGLRPYTPAGRRVWLRRDEVEAFTPPDGIRGPAHSPEVIATLLRPDLTLGEAAFLVGMTPSAAHQVRDHHQRRRKAKS